MTSVAPSTWLLAIRPKTLPASASGVIVGLGAAVAGGTSLHVLPALGCLAVALLLQVAANLANDLSDFRRGADTPDRLGPTRVAAAGLVTTRQLELAIALVLGAAAVIGLWLATVGGPVLIVLGAAAILATLAYTGGPLPYGYRGLGEVAVFVFFGLVAVVGTAEVQVGRVELVHVVAAIPVGLLTVAILVVNNLRDIDTDRAAGKRTLAVMLGSRFAELEYGACLAIAWVIPLLLALGWALGVSGLVLGSNRAAGVLVLLPLVAVPLAPPLWRAVRAGGDRRRLNPVLGGTARLDLVFALLFAIGLAAARAIS